MTPTQLYTRRLTFELRLKNVPGDVIGDAVAQVESHVADTGEDPETAFGSPREYAATFADGPSRPHRWPWYIANWLIGFLLGCLFILGVFGQVRNENVLWGIPPVAAIVVGALGLVAYFLLLSAMWRDRIKDPRRVR